MTVAAVCARCLTLARTRRDPGVDMGLAADMGWLGRASTVKSVIAAADTIDMAKLVTTLLGQALHGSTGNVTFIRSRYGTVVRTRTMPRDPRTDAQWLARSRMTRAGSLWREMTREQVNAWNQYAAQTAMEAGIGPEEPTPTGQQVFTRLTIKLLQVDDQALPPLLPPASPFAGDGIRLTATGLAQAVRFSVTGANAPGVVTELLLQPLPSANRRAYLRRYRSKAFVSFSGEGESHDVPATRGTYSVAYRFVDAATGQCTGLAILGLVEVGS
ncbi:MAG: hypothetical protein HONBIEJF_00692 [Fimbriimonadaceae bacterium]|nr:hypothetical protein [Fimbriimonadaceae bacterium]